MGLSTHRLVRRPLPRKPDPPKKKNTDKNWFSIALTCLITVLLVKWLWPWAIPFGFWQFWFIKGSVLDILKVSWILFVLYFLLNIKNLQDTRNDPKVNKHAELILVGGGINSAFAGVFEEITFRWWMFYSSMATLQLANFLIFGWLGFGIFEWIHNHVLGVFVNFVSYGILESQLFNQAGWFVGAALLSSNWQFRNGHLYLRVSGWLSAWFAGLVFFYLMFNFGLPVAILVHFSLDMFVYILAYLDAYIERALGYV